MWNSQGQWRPSWKCHNMWHIRKMLFMLLLNSVQSLTVLTFCAQWMVLAALLLRMITILLAQFGNESHVFKIIPKILGKRSHNQVKKPRPGLTRNKIPWPNPKIFLKMFPDPGPDWPGKLRVTGCPAGLLAHVPIKDLLPIKDLHGNP